MKYLFLLGFLLVSFARAQVVEWQDVPYTTRVDLASVAGPRVISVNGSTGVVSMTLATAAQAGGFAGTETISPLSVSAHIFGVGAGQGASGSSYTAFGYNAGQNASGIGWSAHGREAGYYASGNSWEAFGREAGADASGDYWLAYGESAGKNAYGNLWSAYGRSTGFSAIHTNSHSFGAFSGSGARGNNRLYFDAYEANPFYSAGGATNDVIFSDAGYLYLGRGAGAPGGAQGGTLRGSWSSGSLSVSGTLTVNGSPVGETTPTYIGIATAGVITVSSGSYYLDLTDWPATGSTWSASTEWDMTPELTVTGRYEFAFSAVGAKLRGRQVWPERQVWRYTPCPQSANAAEPLFGGKAYISIATASALTNYCVYSRDAACPMIAEVSLYHLSTYDRTNELVVAMQSQSAAVLIGAATTNALSAKPASLIWRSRHFVPSVDGVATYTPVLRVTVIKPNAFANNVVIEPLRWRCATALEQLAFDVGWRP